METGTGLFRIQKKRQKKVKKDGLGLNVVERSFVFDLVQEELYIGMIYHKNEAPDIRECLNKSDYNLLYATADFINELIYK